MTMVCSEPYIVRVVNNELGFILFSFSFISFCFILSFFFLYLNIGEERQNVTSLSHKSHAHMMQWNNVEDSRDDDVI